MSDSEKPAAGAVAQFTERELQLLSWAMQSLKSGPPEIDYEKLAVFAGMGNPRSASNAWAKIKGKLMTSTDGSVKPATPGPKGGRKKTTNSSGEDGEARTKKTPTSRKRTNKKQDVESGDSSPTKKSRVKSPPVVEKEEDANEEFCAEACLAKLGEDEV